MLIIKLRTRLRIHHPMSEAVTQSKHFWQTYLEPDIDVVLWVDPRLFERLRFGREERADGTVEFQFPRNFNLCYDLVSRLEDYHEKAVNDWGATKHRDTRLAHVVRDLPKWVAQIKSACGNEWWDSEAADRFEAIMSIDRED